jgi:hypothetical protein
MVILDERTGRIHRLHATASFLWNRLGGGTSLARIASDMLRAWFRLRIGIHQLNGVADVRIR